MLKAPVGSQPGSGGLAFALVCEDRLSRAQVAAKLTGRHGRQVRPRRKGKVPHKAMPSPNLTQHDRPAPTACRSRRVEHATVGS